LSEQQHIAAKA